MDVEKLNDKHFTLWLTDEHDESAIFSGITHWDGTKLFLERVPKPSFEIRPEWYDRIQKVTNDEVRSILLGADYFLRLYVGTLPDGSEAGYEPTGLRWPE
jgi:hypothetical protein